MTRILGLVVVLMFAVLSMQAATEFVIEGVILDENAVPLIGANILIEGTTKGVVSDLDGKFIINSSTKCIDLQISFIGFEVLLKEICGRVKNQIVLTKGVTLMEVLIKGNKQPTIKSFSSVCYCSVVPNDSFSACKEDTTEVQNMQPIASFEISCYPIPAKEYVSINLEKDIDKLEIFDIQGQLLMTKLAMEQGTSTVYIDNLPAGAYVFKFTKGVEVQTVRVSKI